jgi:hypothetical protein
MTIEEYNDKMNAIMRSYLGKISSEETAHKMETELNQLIKEFQSCRNFAREQVAKVNTHPLLKEMEVHFYYKDEPVCLNCYAKWLRKEGFEK